ncbi:hypothetical protein CAPTEDRAFT_60351, partial [Capitella teleta]
CILGKDEGIGGMSETRYFFRASKGRCYPFDFHGTGGNGNNFKTEVECVTSC